MLIRSEIDSDAAAIRSIVTTAMLTLAQATGTEAQIVDRLRAEGALSLSLVAEDGGGAVGYLAASGARVGAVSGWALIGPLAVLPSRHGKGIGSALMVEAIRLLRPAFKGAALVGNPRYYGRFGFRSFPGLELPGFPPEVLQALPFDGAEPAGELIHHPAFGLEQTEQGKPPSG